MKQARTSVSDYGPGHDAEAAFKQGFTDACGTGEQRALSGRTTPISCPSCSASSTRSRRLYAFLPGGTQPAAFVKAFNELGLAKARIRLMPSAEATDE